MDHSKDRTKAISSSEHDICDVLRTSIPDRDVMSAALPHVSDTDPQRRAIRKLRKESISPGSAPPSNSPGDPHFHLEVLPGDFSSSFNPTEHRAMSPHE